MDNIKIETNLNSRQFRLYDYLKERGDQWTTQFKIVNDLRHLYHYEEDDLVTFHDNPARHLLTKDIRAINESDYLPKPILSSAKGIKIANKEEFDTYMNKNFNSLLERMKRLKKLAAKGNKDGQYCLKLSKYQQELYQVFID